MTNFYDEINRNKRDSMLLSTIVFLILSVMAYIIGYVFAPGYWLMLVAISLFLIMLDLYLKWNYGKDCPSIDQRKAS